MNSAARANSEHKLTSFRMRSRAAPPAFYQARLGGPSLRSPPPRLVALSLPPTSRLDQTSLHNEQYVEDVL